MREGSGPPPTRRGIPFDQAASALQKALRRGDEETALRFAAELDASGFSAYVWRRLVVITSEDVGLADPHLPATVAALHTAWNEARKQRRDGGQMFMAHAVLLLARAPKDRTVDHALVWAWSETEPLEVPDVALDKHTAAGRGLGRRWAHFWDEASLLLDRHTGELRHSADRYRERAIASTGKPAQNPQSGSSGQVQGAADDC